MAPLRLAEDRDGMAIGDPDAPLVMVAFESFGCLWCGNFHRTTMPMVLDEYVESGQLRIETRMLPYEERAVPGARIGAAAGMQDRYWALAEHLYPFIAGSGEPPVGRDLTSRELDAYRDRQAEGALLEDVATPDAEGRALLTRVAKRFGLSARGYHRVLRVARTIADLEGAPDVRRPHVAEALSYRLTATVAA